MKRSGFSRPAYTRPKRQPAKPIPENQRRGTMAACDGIVRSAGKAPAPTRSEAYRRLVAQLPCYHCGIEGASQAAHPNTGKALGRKQSDMECFPMCHEGANGCHTAYDQYRLVPKALMREYEQKAAEWTANHLGCKPEDSIDSED